MAQQEFVSVLELIRLKELLALSRSHLAAGQLIAGQKVQWSNLATKFAHPHRPWRASLVFGKESFRSCRRTV